MKVKVLSLLVPALLVAGAANAAEVYTLFIILCYHRKTITLVNYFTNN